MVVEGPRGDARPLADIPDGHPVKAVLPGQVQGGLEDGLFGLLGLLLPALAIIHLDPFFPLTSAAFSRYNDGITTLCD